MKLLIRLENGAPFEHPILEENFKQAFPDVDTDNLPSWVAQFVRKDKRPTEIFEVYEGATYGWDNGVVVDVHHYRPMTATEKEVVIRDAEAQYKEFIDSEIKDAAQKLISATNANKKYWQQYFDALNAWELLDIQNPNLPTKPEFNEYGQYLEPVVIGVTRV